MLLLDLLRARARTNAASALADLRAAAREQERDPWRVETTVPAQRAVPSGRHLG